MILELLESTRSYRRFREEVRLSDDHVLALAEAIRLSPSAGNLQRIRICPITDRESCARVFSTLAFAAYLKDWQGPSEGERPAAYAVVMCKGEPDINLAIDSGLCMEAMLLTARERGIGGCIFRSFNKPSLTAILGKEDYTPIAVVALGYPAEQVVLTEVKEGDIKYYRDSQGTHFVPKHNKEDYVI